MGIGGLCGQVQAPERFSAHVSLPEDHRAAAPVFQDLLGRPQRVASSLGTHPQQAIDVDAPGLQGFGVGNVRRLNQRDTPLLSQLLQDGLEQLKFANTRLLHQ